MQNVKLSAAQKYKLKRSAGKFSVSALRMLVLIGLSFIILFPIFNLITFSIKHSEEYFDATIIWFSNDPTLENFKNALKAINFWESFLNTVKMTVPSVGLQLFACSIAGYGFSRFDFPGKKILFALLIFLIIVPPQVVTTPTFIYYRNFDFFGIGKLVGLITGTDLTVSILNTGWSLYLPAMFGCGIRGALFIFIFNQFFKGLPKDLEEAAAIDGCGALKTFFKIMLPNAIPVVITVLIFSMVWYYNDTYVSGIFITNQKTLAMSLMSVPDALTTMTMSHQLVMSDPYKANLALQAATLLYLVPPLIIYLPLQKFFVESIDRTGIVG